MIFIKQFDEIGRDDIDEAGGKGANLGELTRADLPVPAGFVVATAAYRVDRIAEGNGLSRDEAYVSSKWRNAQLLTSSTTGSTPDRRQRIVPCAADGSNSAASTQTSCERDCSVARSWA